MKWLAYGLVGFCSGAFVGWGAYVSYIDNSGWAIGQLLAAFLGAAIGTGAAITFGWSLRSRRR